MQRVSFGTSDLPRHESVDSAFDFVEAHPASSATAFALGHARARLATDGTIAAIVQRIVRDFVLPEIGPHRFVAPIGHRIELNDVVARTVTHGVQLDYANVGTGM